jgi:hypothetical protein
MLLIAFGTIVRLAALGIGEGLRVGLRRWTLDEFERRSARQARREVEYRFGVLSVDVIERDGRTLAAAAAAAAAAPARVFVFGSHER